VAKAAVYLINVPLDRPRLGGLLLRCAIFGAALLWGVLSLAMSLISQSVLVLLPVIWLGLFGWLFWVFARNECSMFFRGHRLFRESYDRAYAQFIYLVPIAPEEAAARLDHPWSRKIIAETLALGHVRVGTIKVMPEVNGEGTFPVFFAPDGVTYFLPNFQRDTSRDIPNPSRMWPAAMVLMAQTFFSNDVRLTSVNNIYMGFRRKLTGPESVGRIFGGVTDPAEFLAQHAAAVKQVAAAQGVEPLPHLNFEAFLHRHEEFQEIERELYQDDPFTWSDAWHFYIQKMRRNQ
jgi:hypothetical protein